jgi:DNA-binding MarR family transcriptional regulator
MLEVLAQFRVVFKTIRRHYQNVERRSGITGALLWALSEIAVRPGCQAGELARALAIHQSTASNLLRRLAARGLVTRQRRSGDQRKVQLFPTKRGLKVLKAAPQPLIGVLQQALSDLPASSLRGLHTDLGRLIKAMRVKSLSAAHTALISEMR